MTFTEDDIEVRLANAKCCAGNLAYKTANAFKYGLSTSKCLLKQLELLEIYIEALCKYQALINEETVSTGTIIITGGTGSTVRGKINGVIISEYTAIDVDPKITASNLNDGINSFEQTTGLPTYTSTVQDVTLTISASRGTGSEPNGYQTTLEPTAGTVIYTTTDFSEGENEVTEKDNCITEEEMQDLFEQINIICKSCSASPNTTYIQ